MSRLNGALYSSEDQTWMSPPSVVDAILAFEGRRQFDLDPACTVKNIPAWRHFIQPEYDGLEDSWLLQKETLVYVNPPYGNQLKKFMAKIALEATKGVRIWALVPARTETEYQHQYGFTQADFTVFLYERLKFWKDGAPYMMPEKKKGVLTGRVVEGTAPFPTMLLYYGADWEEKARRWARVKPLKGTVMVNLDK